MVVLAQRSTKRHNHCSLIRKDETFIKAVTEKAFLSMQL